MKTTYFEQKTALDSMLKAHGISCAELERKFAKESRGDALAKRFLDDFSKQYRLMLDVVAEQKRAARSDKGARRVVKALERSAVLKSELRQELRKAGIKSDGLSSRSRLKADSRDWSYVEATIRGKTELTSNEALIVYSNSKTHSGCALSMTDITNRGAADIARESGLTGAAVRYCKRMGYRVK